MYKKNFQAKLPIIISYLQIKKPNLLKNQIKIRVVTSKMDNSYKNKMYIHTCAHVNYENKFVFSSNKLRKTESM